MNIIVTVKQVPETGNVAMDEKTGTMKRDGIESILNPLDLYAVEAAVLLKERFGGRVTAVSMGPASAVRSLREAVAMGCDGGVLVTGRDFAGSDTLATSRALARAAGMLRPWDLILAGERATDGDTGQVGPGIAALLGIPVATYVSRIGEIGNGRIVVDRLTEAGYETLALRLPALLTVVKEASDPRLPTLGGKRRARETEFRILSAADLGIEPSLLGLKGSPTRVERIYSPKVARNGIILRAKDDRSLEEAVSRCAEYIEKKAASCMKKSGS